MLPTTIEESAGVTTNEARVRGEGLVPALPHPAILKHMLIAIKNAITRRIWVFNRTADALISKASSSVMPASDYPSGAKCDQLACAAGARMPSSPRLQRIEEESDQTKVRYRQF